MEKFLNLGCGARICSDPRWGTFFLDTDTDGTEHAPNSVNMEAVRS